MLSGSYGLDLQFTEGNWCVHADQISFAPVTHAIPAHSHGSGCYEIHYIPSGYGRAQIQGEFYSIAPNTLYVTGPHIEHAQIPLSENPMLEYCLYIRLEKSKIRPQNFSETPLSAFAETCFWFGEDRENISGYFSDIFQEMQERKAGFTVKIETLLEHLLVHMVRNYFPSSALAGENKKFLPLRAADSMSLMIERVFLYEYRTVTLPDLSSRLGLSSRQTQRLLQEQYGQTFLEKKMQARMSAAALLCSDFSRSISSIAEDVGYSSMEHFSAAFKKYYSVSPREYRKRLSLSAFSLQDQPSKERL